MVTDKHQRYLVLFGNTESAYEGPAIPVRYQVNLTAPSLINESA